MAEVLVHTFPGLEIAVKEELSGLEPEITGEGLVSAKTKPQNTTFKKLKCFLSTHILIGHIKQDNLKLQNLHDAMIKAVNTETLNQAVVHHEDYSKRAVRTFKARGFRTGKHDFNRIEAERVLAQIVLKLNAKVSGELRSPDAEFWAFIQGDRIWVTMKLYDNNRPHSIIKARRCALHPAIASFMVREAEIKCGDIVCDPLCGSGEIPFQVNEICSGGSYVLGGDINKREIGACLERSSRECIHNWLLWDSQKLPLCDESMDCFISDLPFGRRVGSFSSNQKLFPRLLKELLRILKVGGIAVLLFVHRKIIERCLLADVKLLQAVSRTKIDYNGIYAWCYKLRKVEKCIQVQPKPPEICEYCLGVPVGPPHKSKEVCPFLKHKIQRTCYDCGQNLQMCSCEQPTLKAIQKLHIAARANKKRRREEEKAKSKLL